MRTRASFSHNPHLRVSRPCDGKLPSCTACEKAGRENECSAASDQQFARGKERSWVAALELRLEKLERRLNHARSRKASVALHESDENTISVQHSERRDSLVDITAAIHRKAARTREKADYNTLVSDFGLLSVNATTRGFDTRESENPMTFARLVLAAAQHDALPDPDTDELPDKEAVEAIFKFYENNVLPLYPLFPAAHLHALIDKMYDAELGFLGAIRSSEYWLFWMVLAIGSAAQSKTMQDRKYYDGLQFVSRALPYADRALVPGYPSQIQSLVLLTQYSMLDPAHFDSWHLIGFACRAVIDLGFHQDHTFTQQSAKDTIDERRRTFYCVYALDSMVHARPFSFKDDDISVQLPSPSVANSSDEPSTRPDSSLPLFKLRRLQSDWYQTLVQTDPRDPLRDPIQYVWQKCHETQKLSKELPPDLPAALSTMFDLEMAYSYVYLIVPSPRGPQLTDHGRLLIFEHTIRYLHRIFEVAKDPVSVGFYTYHDALKVFFMGSQLVTVLRDPGDTVLWQTLGYLPGLTAPGQPPLPDRVDWSIGRDNLDRSLLCLEKVSETLKRYGERWESVKTLAEHFDKITADMKSHLEMRRGVVKSVINAQRDSRRPLPGSRPPQNPPTLAYQQLPMAQHSPQQANQGGTWGNSTGFQGHHNGQF
ncbi:fungal-specific transcription factor domain-containing protein [Apiosordaria backusii]|uniref:Fungal-specific transcription factor domain-containing protein n=1 Tax=Apiosordaria backusii TaxID=314023 RepID=A0AA40BL76_9PEZI|nr:fungal-specific transcription factor domain-containing protein [Apiosordaria backusii]